MMGRCDLIPAYSGDHLISSSLLISARLVVASLEKLLPHGSVSQKQTSTNTKECGLANHQAEHKFKCNCGVAGY